LKNSSHQLVSFGINNNSLSMWWNFPDELIAFDFGNVITRTFLSDDLFYKVFVKDYLKTLERNL